MRSSWFILLLLLASYSAEAQSNTSPRVKYYTWVHFYDGSKTIKGVLLQANDSSIYFVEKSGILNNKIIAPVPPQVIPVIFIEKIKIRKPGSIGKGILTGAIGGVIVGGVIGFISGDDECVPTGGWFDCMYVLSAEDKALVGSTIGGISGISLGALLGSKRKTFQINGDLRTYTNIRNALMSYTLTQQDL